MTNDMIAFLRARLDEDADTARQAHKHGVGRWHSGIHPDYVEEWGISGDGVVDDNHQTVVYDEGYPSKEQSEHIARHDPARVLAEVETKRAIINELEPSSREPETGEELHSRFAHPAYEYRTTTGPRKQWDDADTPPVDESFNPDPTWERNTDAGIGGWMRFDFAEESYWRRLRTDGPEPAPAAPRILLILALPYADHPDYRPEWRP